MFFTAGLVTGIACMAFLFILNGIHCRYHEIEWHDAQKERPSQYVIGGVCDLHIRVLIHTVKGVIIDSTYYPDSNHYDYEDCANITHFAYIEEIKNTVPSCPVCSGTVAANQLDHYAYQSAL